MKKFIKNSVILFILGSSNALSAQEIIRSTFSSAGVSSNFDENNTTYVIQQSIGQQSITGTSLGNDFILRQGFIQPPIDVVISVPEDNTLAAFIFPNPFKSRITVKFLEEIEAPIDIIVYDVLGRLIVNKKQQVNGLETIIYLDQLASAQYLLSITAGVKQFNASIIKN